MPLYPHKVPVTIDGVIYKISEGVQSFVGICDAAGIDPSTKKLITVVSSPAVPTSVNPNGSMAVRGGEVFTTS